MRRWRRCDETGDFRESSRPTPEVVAVPSLARISHKAAWRAANYRFDGHFCFEPCQHTDSRQSLSRHMPLIWPHLSSPRLLLTQPIVIAMATSIYLGSEAARSKQYAPSIRDPCENLRASGMECRPGSGRDRRVSHRVWAVAAEGVGIEPRPANPGSPSGVKPAKAIERSREAATHLPPQCVTLF
jgi:hypothetical protein